MPGMEETIEICYMNYIEKCLDSDHPKEYGFLLHQLLWLKEWCWKKHLGMTEVWQNDHANTEEKCNSKVIGFSMSRLSTLQITNGVRALTKTWEAAESNR